MMRATQVLRRARTITSSGMAVTSSGMAPEAAALQGFTNLREDCEPVRAPARALASGNPDSPHLKQRTVPFNLRQSGDNGEGGLHGAGSRMLIDMRLHKSPFWHLSQEQGAWCYSVYNKFYHPRAYVKPEDGGLMQEYKWLTEDVTMWNVAVERQTCVKGPDAERFTDELITRRAGLCKVGHCKYVILCNPAGGILNDPVLLRPSEDEFWLSLADSDITMYAQGLNHGLRMNVEITEIDVCPVQIQGPKSTALMVDLCGPEIEAMPYYGLLHSTVGGCPVVISRTGFSAERGYEIYLYNATVNAEKMWYAVLEAGEKHNLHVIAPGHHRRIEAGILSYGQDMDIETNPFEVGLGWQVDLTKDSFVGKEALAKIKAEGVTHKLCGIQFGGEPITWYPADFYHVKSTEGELVGHVTSAWFSPTMGSNVGFAFVPRSLARLGTELEVALPKLYNPSGERVSAEVVKTPFKLPAAEEQGTGLRTTGSKL